MVADYRGRGLYAYICLALCSLAAKGRKIYNGREWMRIQGGITPVVNHGHAVRFPGLRDYDIFLVAYRGAGFARGSVTPMGGCGCDEPTKHDFAYPSTDAYGWDEANLTCPDILGNVHDCYMSM